ncbi:hypothetical protein AJ78_02306 [Emergomyces pasteurianus Ep9510]|uniref:Uncharacterized protein n=1 Tax=Emergomyces pasteurianus Ep9510 TaxID=1447872 RepID=A0A1J9QN57_9EURO|nr:hypothetical protein AJ78_02306 [Emergomyces pasteurianus Ep9510]
MASADIPRDGLRHTVVISSDAEMDERQPPAQKLRGKRPRTDYSYPMHGLNLTTRRPPKCGSRRKEVKCPAWTRYWGARAHRSSKDRNDSKNVIDGSFKFFPSHAGKLGGFADNLQKAGLVVEEGGLKGMLGVLAMTLHFTNL